jgi:hypothetical protein
VAQRHKDHPEDTRDHQKTWGPQQTLGPEDTEQIGVLVQRLRETFGFQFDRVDIDFPLAVFLIPKSDSS